MDCVQSSDKYYTLNTNFKYDFIIFDEPLIKLD